MQRESVLAARQARKAVQAQEAEELKQLMAEENIMDDDEKVWTEGADWGTVLRLSF